MNTTEYTNKERQRTKHDAGTTQVGVKMDLNLTAQQPDIIELSETKQTELLFSVIKIQATQKQSESQISFSALAGKI